MSTRPHFSEIIGMTADGKPVRFNELMNGYIDDLQREVDDLISRVATLETTSADHETRITDLE